MEVQCLVVMLYKGLMILRVKQSIERAAEDFYVLDS